MQFWKLIHHVQSVLHLAVNRGLSFLSASVIVRPPLTAYIVWLIPFSNRSCWKMRGVMDKTGPGALAPDDNDNLTHSMFTREVTSTQTNWTPSMVKLHLLSTSTFAQCHLNSSFLHPSVASLMFSLSLINEYDAVMWTYNFKQ